jgi:putative ABC transport system permease protein
MSLWHIAWSYLWNRKFTTCLTILSVALSVGLISSVLSLREELEKRFAEEGQAFDLVVGPKGSPLQLVLGSVYFLDSAIGRTPLHVYEMLRKDSEFVEAAFPIGLGDTYGGFRIVGTSRELLDHEWVGFSGDVRKPFALQDGEYFESTREAVVGSVAARQLGLQIGDEFESIHGSFAISEDLREFDHADHPYTVVGILKPSGSPFDRAIYCSIESIWDAHGHADDEEHGEDDHGDEDMDEHAHEEGDGHAHEEGDGHAHDKDDDHTEVSEEIAAEEMDFSNSLSAVLVQLHSPAQRFEYEGYINEQTDAMAVVPIQIISDFFRDFLDPIKGLMMGVGYLVVVISALSILIGLYLSIMQRKRDLAIMRALGASSYEIFGAVIIEAFWVTTLGIGVGWVFGNVVTYLLGIILAREYGLIVSPFGLSSEEIRAFATVALVGLVAGVLPAWQAYNSDVAHDLADRQ